MADLAYQISLTLGDHADDYDIPAIITDLRKTHPGLGNIDDIASAAYWEAVKRHDRTADPVAAAQPLDTPARAGDNPEFPWLPLECRTGQCEHPTGRCVRHRSRRCLSGECGCARANRACSVNYPA